MRKPISLLFLLLGSQIAQASTGELYGYGSRASALGNTMLGGTTDGFATFYNPAANSSHPGLQIGIATSFAHPSFLDIKSVTVDNSAVGSAIDNVTGDIDTSSYLDVLAQAVALSLNLGERLKNLTLGATAIMPLARLAYLDTGEPFKPEYFSYRSRTQRPQIYASLSLTPLSHFHVGTGLAFATNLSASTTVFATGDAHKISSQRFAATIKPSVAPYFSVFADPKPWQAGLVIRLPNTYKVSVDSNAKASFLGGTANLPVNINSSSSLFYDPLEVDMGLSYDLFEKTFVTLEMDWLQYKAFESPTLTVIDLGSVGGLRNSISNLPEMQNIFVPKVGVAQTFDLFILRGGYGYRPSPVKDNSGPGNLIDPAKHVFTAGLGIDLKKAGVTEKEIFLDLDAQYHLLVKQHVNKAPGNELGLAGSSGHETKIGGPGYDIGGSIYGGGLSLSMSF